EQALAHPPQHRVEIVVAVTDQQVVTAAGIAGRRHPELARRIAAEKIPADDAVTDYVAVDGGDAFIIERRAGDAARQVRPFADRDVRREYRLAEAVEQERRLAIQAAAADGRDEVSDQARGDRRLE